MMNDVDKEKKVSFVNELKELCQKYNLLIDTINGYGSLMVDKPRYENNIEYFINELLNNR